LVTYELGFVDVLTSFCDQRSKVKVTASNDYIPDEYNIFVNI